MYIPNYFKNYSNNSFNMSCQFDNKKNLYQIKNLPQILFHSRISGVLQQMIVWVAHIH